MNEYELAGIETIARGVCIKDGRVLVCRNKSVGNVYLPGGHIEFGETGAEALEREVMEEIGVASSAREFLGCCEHSFTQHGGKPHAEINLVYALEAPSLSPDAPVPSREDWICFDWIALADLDSSTLEPAVLRDKIATWHASREASASRLATTPRHGA
ncbi:MAG: NUDIX domain-containing protein [Kiritimatiellae bacterium]|nr:NUDIX domain-containing protein [Kiritimatiellia bacterium]